jgi:glycosyltransferase involved in cell wall biosynthesis
LRVLQVHNRYRSSSPSGENQVVDSEAAGLRLHGHTVEGFERLSDEIEDWGAPRRMLLAGRAVWSLETHTKLLSTLRESRPDVVHVHNTFPLLSPSVLSACYRERLPVVATLHNYRLVCPTGELFRDGAVCHDCIGRLPVPAVRHGCYKGSSLATLPLAASAVVNRRAWRERVSAYVCISEFQRDRLIPFGLPSNRVFVKTNLVKSATPEPSSNRRAAVVFVGRLAETKGILVLMKAWDIYSASSAGEGLRLVIAGAGPLEEAVAAWARGRSDVDFLGMLSNKECEVLLKGARAAVIPSEWEEPFGLVALEAMGAGLPVIASDHGAFPELIVDQEEGRLFAPGDAAALAMVFDDVETAPERYERYGRNARRAYETRFSPDLNVTKLLSIYEFPVKHPVWGPEPE